MKPEVLIVGGGMITHDQILPSVYQMQRNGVVGEITVCAQHRRTVKALAEAAGILKAFPGQSFKAFPDPSKSAPEPELYKELIARMPPRNIVIVAAPDQLHYDAVMTALRHDQHVCCVKPLVHKVEQSIEIEKEAYGRGLIVGIEYHKRFDDRSFRARRLYRDGFLGEFQLGTARLMEKWYYRNSNFMNWCTKEHSDAFTYIGCHYVDLVHYITGLLPTSVSNYGIIDTYPNGREGYLWCDTRVKWQNGAALNVQTTLCYPDEAPGPNTQGMTLYTRGTSVDSRGAAGAGLLDHSDQYRGLAYSMVKKPDVAGATFYSEPSPDYFQYNDVGGPGLQAVGYGYRSVEFILRQCIEIEQVADKQGRLKELDAAGVLATPANSRYNELVMEAGRLSILNGGREVSIDSSGEYGGRPSVRFA